MLRRTATWTVFLAAFALVGALLVWLVPTVADEFGSVGRNATRGVHKIQHWLITGPLHLSSHDVHHEFNQVGRYFSSHASGLAVQGATLAVEIVVGLLLTMVVTFFLVKDADRITVGALNLLGERYGEHSRTLGARCWATLTGYIRGTTVNGLINGTLMAIGLSVLGVPLALPIGVLTFFGGYFPIVGSIVSGGSRRSSRSSPLVRRPCSSSSVSPSPSTTSRATSSVLSCWGERYISTHSQCCSRSQSGPSLRASSARSSPYPSRPSAARLPPTTGS